jgi:hypothetical protein
MGVPLRAPAHTAQAGEIAMKVNHGLLTTNRHELGEQRRESRMCAQPLQLFVFIGVHSWLKFLAMASLSGVIRLPRRGLGGGGRLIR